jgi:hypothetical protein
MFMFSHTREQMLPSEKDSPETLRSKMGAHGHNVASVPIPTTASKFGKKETQDESNPFGYAQEDSDRYWYVLFIQPMQHAKEEY